MKRSFVAILVAVAACAALVEWSSCGSSSSVTPTPDPPTPGTTTVSSVAVTGGNAKSMPTEGVITADTTNVSTGTTAFTVTFSAAMDATTVTATNITLECPTGTAQTLGDIAATDSTNTAFTIATTAALPEKTICTATFGTGLVDATNHSLSAAATGTFTTGCSSSDPFTKTATITSGTGCWTHAADALTTVTIGTNGLDMVRQPPPTDENDVDFMSKTFGSGDISTSVTLTQATGFSSDFIGDNSCMFAYVNNSDFEFTSAGLIFVVGNKAGGSGFALRVTDMAQMDGDMVEISLLSAISADSPLTITINRTGTTFTASYKEGSGAVTPITLLPGWTDLDVGSTPAIALGINSKLNVNLPVTCTFSNFTVSGGSATAPNPTDTTGGQD